MHQVGQPPGNKLLHDAALMKLQDEVGQEGEGGAVHAIGQTPAEGIQEALKAAVGRVVDPILLGRPYCFKLAAVPLMRYQLCVHPASAQHAEKVKCQGRLATHLH